MKHLINYLLNAMDFKKDSELLTTKEAAQLFGISLRKFHQLSKNEWMPEPITLGERLTRWSKQELIYAIHHMPRKQLDKREEPKRLSEGKEKKKSIT